MINILKSVKVVLQTASNTGNFISYQVICLIYVTLEVNTILIGGADAQFQKIPNCYETSCQICVDFFLGQAVVSQSSKVKLNIQFNTCDIKT